MSEIESIDLASLERLRRNHLVDFRHHFNTALPGGDQGHDVLVSCLVVFRRASSSVSFDCLDEFCLRWP